MPSNSFGCGTAGVKGEIIMGDDDKNKSKKKEDAGWKSGEKKISVTSVINKKKKLEEG